MEVAVDLMQVRSTTVPRRAVENLGYRAPHERKLLANPFAHKAEDDKTKHVPRVFAKERKFCHFKCKGRKQTITINLTQQKNEKEFNDALLMSGHGAARCNNALIRNFHHTAYHANGKEYKNGCKKYPADFKPHGFMRGVRFICKNDVEKVKWWAVTVDPAARVSVDGRLLTELHRTHSKYKGGAFFYPAWIQFDTNVTDKTLPLPAPKKISPKPKPKPKHFAKPGPPKPKPHGGHQEEHHRQLLAGPYDNAPAPPEPKVLPFGTIVSQSVATICGYEGEEYQVAIQKGTDLKLELVNVVVEQGKDCTVARNPVIYWQYDVVCPMSTKWVSVRPRMRDLSVLMRVDGMAWTPGE
ncbi:unnamed protein product, partial [Amoebophrya sp. A120]|eukprot:GSA120T00002637001.1